MPTLKAQLRDLRAANVYKAALHEDGALKAVEFFRSLDDGGQPADGASPANAQKPFRAKEIDLLQDVIMAEHSPVVLTTEDFPPEVVEAADDVSEADPTEGE
jgi:hypothetical protein